MSKKTDVYVAQAVSAPIDGLKAVQAPSYKIEVRFSGGLTPTQRTAFKLAADRWVRAIVGKLPSVRVDGELVEGLLILAQGTPIDGPGRILGQAGPTHLRPATAGAAAYLPAKGMMSFDTADLAEMEQKGTLNDVIAHEMGHVIGIGTIWDKKQLLKGAHTANPTFTGAAAQEEYGKLKGGQAQPVPVENTDGPGTQDSHWRDVVFGNELMTGFVSDPGNPLSRLTIASLQDIGYQVDLGAAEAYSLPTMSHLMEMGLLSARATAFDGHDHDHAMPIIPFTLPTDSLE